MNVALVNGITLLRIPLTFLFCAVLLFVPHLYFLCFIIFALVVASDYCDGKLARKYNAETALGARLDVIADFFFILLSYLTLYYIQLVPGWIILVSVWKFAEFWLTSVLSRKHSKGEAVFLFDPIGRTFAVMLYLLPLFLLIQNDIPLQPYVTEAVCGIIALLAVVSSVFRIGSLIKNKIKNEYA